MQGIWNGWNIWGEYVLFLHLLADSSAFQHSIALWAQADQNLQAQGGSTGLGKQGMGVVQKAPENMLESTAVTCTLHTAQYPFSRSKLMWTEQSFLWKIGYLLRVQCCSCGRYSTSTD